MSRNGHPLKGHARHVQHVLEADASLCRPSYQWCLAQVQHHLEAAKAKASPGSEGYNGRLRAALVECIKPSAAVAG